MTPRWAQSFRFCLPSRHHAIVAAVQCHGPPKSARLGCLRSHGEIRYFPPLGVFSCKCGPRFKAMHGPPKVRVWALLWTPPQDDLSGIRLSRSINVGPQRAKISVNIDAGLRRIRCISRIGLTRKTHRLWSRPCSLTLLCCILFKCCPCSNRTRVPQS